MPEIRFTQAARRHKVGRARVLFVIDNPFVTFEKAAPDDMPEGVTRTMHLGDDHTGRALEVMTVELDNGDLLVVHAMDLQDKYRPLYDAGKADQ